MSHTSVQIRHGAEGPPSDPYGFREILVRRGGTQILLHEGLITFLSVNGIKFTGVQNSEKVLVDIFTLQSGLSPQKWDRVYRRLRTRCKFCGSKRIDHGPGMPGEYLYICGNSQCGKIIASDFNESEVI